MRAHRLSAPHCAWECAPGNVFDLFNDHLHDLPSQTFNRLLSRALRKTILGHILDFSTNLHHDLPLKNLAAAPGMGMPSPPRVQPRTISNTCLDGQTATPPVPCPVFVRRSRPPGPQTVYNRTTSTIFQDALKAILREGVHRHNDFCLSFHHPLRRAVPAKSLP